MLALGAVLVLDRGISDAVEVPAGVAAAGLASALALLAVTVDETDEAFANVYSAAVSLQNVVPARRRSACSSSRSRSSRRSARSRSSSRSYETFLLLLGSFFVPLFGVLLADWLLSGASYADVDFFAAPAFRPGPIGAWLAGFALYQWLHPLGPSWWVELVASDEPAARSARRCRASRSRSRSPRARDRSSSRRPRPAPAPA